MSSISDFIFSSIRSKLPNVNWKLGSVIRELIAEPIIKVAESATSAVDQHLNAANVSKYIDNPDKYKESIESLYSSLGLTEDSSVASTGVVTIFTDSATVLPVFKGTVMYYGDNNIYVSSDVYPDLINKNNDNRFVQLRRLGVNSYAFDVPVSSFYGDANLSEGTSLTWDEAPDYVYNIKVSSTISGGSSGITVKEKAERIKDYVAQPLLTFDEGITKLLRHKFPEVVVDSAFVKKNNANGKSYLYVKTAKAPSTYYRTSVATKGEDGLYHIHYKSYGVIDIVEVQKGSEILDIISSTVSNNTVNAIIDMEGDGDVQVTIKLRGLEDLEAVQEFIDGYTIGSPYRVEVCAPPVFYIGCLFKYKGNLTSMALNRLCELVKDCALKETPTDLTLKNALNEDGVTVIDSIIFATSTSEGMYYKQKNTPMISGNVDCYACYMSVDRIETVNV